MSEFTEYFQEIENYPVLTSEEELRIAKAYKETHDEKYREILVKHNLRFVLYVVKSFKNVDVDAMDLIQAGNVGLMRAVERFDPDAGYKFSTYCEYWIRAEVLDLVNKESNKYLKTSTWYCLLKQRYLKYVKEYEICEGSHGLPPDSAIAKELGCSEMQLNNVRKILQPVVFLNATYIKDYEYAEEPSELGDMIRSTDPMPEDVYEEKELCMTVDKAVKSLPVKWQTVLVQHVGLDGNEPKTFEQIAEEQGYTRQWAQVLYSRALDELRHSQYTKQLKEFI